jgi:hypothetical protein
MAGTAGTAGEQRALRWAGSRARVARQGHHRHAHRRRRPRQPHLRVHRLARARPDLTDRARHPGRRDRRSDRLRTHRTAHPAILLCAALLLAGAAIAITTIPTKHLAEGTPVRTHCDIAGPPLHPRTRKPATDGSCGRWDCGRPPRRAPIRRFPAHTPTDRCSGQTAPFGISASTTCPGPDRWRHELHHPRRQRLLHRPAHRPAVSPPNSSPRCRNPANPTETRSGSASHTPRPHVGRYGGSAEAVSATASTLCSADGTRQVTLAENMPVRPTWHHHPLRHHARVRDYAICART